MRRMTIALAAGVLALGAVTTAGWAQISSSGEPFMVSADDLELVQADGVQIWRGRAEAVQGENRLRAVRFGSTTRSTTVDSARPNASRPSGRSFS